MQKSRLQYRIGHILDEFTEITLFRFLMKNHVKNKNRTKATKPTKTNIGKQYHLHISTTIGYIHLYTSRHIHTTGNTTKNNRITTKIQDNVLYYGKSVERKTRKTRNNRITFFLNELKH